MTRKVVDAELEHYDVGNSGNTPDNTIDGTDLESVSFTEKTQGLVDTGSMTLHNENWQYTGTVTLGDRLVFRTQLDGEGSLSDRWTALVKGITYREPTSSEPPKLDLSVSDFVFAVMGMREVYNAFKDRQISGSTNSILETVLDDKASEIDQSQIATISDTANVKWLGRTLLDCVRRLAIEADAYLAQDGTSLVFDKLTAPSVKFTLGSSDRLTATVNETTDGLTNQWRINGGTGEQKDDSQETQSSTETVTDSNRKTVQVSTTKSELAFVDIYTQTTGSGDNMVVRLQENDAGSPIAPNDRQADIVNKTLASPFLATDGYTRFLFKTHSFTTRDPHVLVESDGSTGQDVGVDGSENLTYKAFFPYPLDTINVDTGSINANRRRENSINDATLNEQALVDGLAQAKLRHTSSPPKTFGFVADSNRAHGLSPGEIIEVDEADLNFQADAMVMKRSDELVGDTNLKSTVTVQNVDTI